MVTPVFSPKSSHFVAPIRLPHPIGCGGHRAKEGEAKEEAKGAADLKNSKNTFTKKYIYFDKYTELTAAIMSLRSYSLEMREIKKLAYQFFGGKTRGGDLSFFLPT